MAWEDLRAVATCVSWTLRDPQVGRWGREGRKDLADGSSGTRGRVEL